jgi:HAD superfamily hydrolase (TIGR01549 family)
MENVKWLFFDVGYTLINEDKCHENRIKNTVSRFQGSKWNITYDSLYEAMIQASREYRQPYAAALQSFGIDYYEPYEKELEEPYAAAESVLKKLRSYYKIGVIANQTPGTVERLRGFGLLHYIDLVLSSAEEGLEKPDVRFYEKALELAECKSSEAVMIGDRLDNDIYPANQVGMITVWIKQGFGGMQLPLQVSYEPDYTVLELVELLGLFVPPGTGKLY